MVWLADSRKWILMTERTNRLHTDSSLEIWTDPNSDAPMPGL
jgi:hypothetical protein